MDLVASETRSVSKFIDKMKTKAGKLEQIIVEEGEVVKAQGKALESVEVSEARFQQKEIASIRLGTRYSWSSILNATSHKSLKHTVLKEAVSSLARAGSSISSFFEQLINKAKELERAIIEEDEVLEAEERKLEIQEVMEATRQALVLLRLFVRPCIDKTATH